jgi:hypothetical protein
MQAHRTPALRLPAWANLGQDSSWWWDRRPGAVLIAGLLAFAAPMKFFVGFLSLAQHKDMAAVVQAGLWWTLYGAIFWIALLVAGQAGARLAQGTSRLRRGGAWLLLALSCAAVPNLATAGRARVLIEHGVVQAVLPMQLYGGVLCFTLAMLYFAHLNRSRIHERSAARLACAQAAQREARRRFVQIDLQAVQARIDPALLFDMLDAVKLAYATDPPRAEHLLDELIAFLRASLPRIRAHTSSVAREIELARAFVRLRSLARCSDWGMQLEVSSQAMHARFPPGALLPLVDSALRTLGGDCALRATCAEGLCRVSLSLPAAPAPTALASVQALLRETDGPAAGLSAQAGPGTCLVTIWVPHEPA